VSELVSYWWLDVLTKFRGNRCVRVLERGHTQRQIFGYDYILELHFLVSESCWIKRVVNVLQPMLLFFPFLLSKQYSVIIRMEQFYFIIKRITD
jgi:hypothetical protein